MPATDEYKIASCTRSLVLKRCKLEAPRAFGANTRCTRLAHWLGSIPSRSSPAECHRHRGAPTTKAMVVALKPSAASATLQRRAATCWPSRYRGVSSESRLLRDASTILGEPDSISQRAKRSPSPLVAPVTM
eukprot:144496-Prymnesium_polylepis.1